MEPSAEADGLRPLGPEALRMRRVLFGLRSAVFVVVGVVAVVAVAFGGGPVVAVGLVAVVLVALWAAFGWWYVTTSFRSWCWGIDTVRFEVRHGVVVRRRMVVPRTRVQHVSTHAGPVQRMFGLVRLEVHTAGARTPNVVVRDLEAGVADELRDVLLAERQADRATALPAGGALPPPPAAVWSVPAPDA